MYFLRDRVIFADDNDTRFWLDISLKADQDEGMSAVVCMSTHFDDDIGNYVFSGTVDECDRYMNVLAAKLEATDLDTIESTCRRYRD